MKKICLLMTLAGIAGCKPFFREFHIKGDVALAAPLVSQIPREGCVLFVIAKNAGGVPIAVKRIVAPQFPVFYVLAPEDLVVPGYKVEGPLTLEAEMNTNGRVGPPTKGDFFGRYPNPVGPRDSGVHIFIDRQF